jgi:hypothetical protein
VPGIHGEKGYLGQIGAHRVSVVGGNTGRPEFLQQHRLEVDEVEERTGQVEDRFAGAHPGALRMVELDFEADASRSGLAFEKRDCEA